jgi:hypothetical protein
MQREEGETSFAGGSLPANDAPDVEGAPWFTTWHQADGGALHINLAEEHGHRSDFVALPVADQLAEAQVAAADIYLEDREARNPSCTD